jgi:hypothetical protein
MTFQSAQLIEVITFAAQWNLKFGIWNLEFGIPLKHISR